MTESGKSARPRRRKLWFVLGGLVVAVALFLLIVPLLIDIENFREPIEQAIRSATGWEAELGEMDFSVWRGMALTVSPARLSAPGESSALDIETIAIKANLLPLLSGRLEVRDVDLVRPDIRLVRESEEDGWMLPLPPPAAAPAETGTASDASSGLKVAVSRIRARRGRLQLEDRTTDPPLSIEVANLNLVISPETGEVSGGGDLADDGGRIEWRGNAEDGIVLELEGLRTELLHPWVGADIVHVGGRLSGDVQVRLPLEIEGKLEGEQVTLLSGERPFDDPLQVDFKLTTQEQDWKLERVEILADGVRLTGGGSLLPDVDLDFEMPSAPLETTLRVTESVLPLPLDLTPPGAVEAEISVERPAGGELSYEAQGSLSAARFKIDDTLPVATDVSTVFELSRQGLLEVRILDGRVGGGPLRGTARIDPIYPPGKLTFDGGLRDAVLGQLLGGLVTDAAEKITGPTGLQAAMGVDLGQEQLDARAISGRLDLSSTEVSLPWDLEGAIHERIEDKLGALGELAAMLDNSDRSPDEGKAENRVEQMLDLVEASVDFNSWPWDLEKLALTADGLTATGAGTFDPEQGNVAIELVSRLDERKTTELVEKYSQLKVLVDHQGRLSLPMRVSGSLLAPSIKADLGKVVTQQLADEPEEVLEGLLNDLLKKKRK
jgi:hypothetical protein